MGQTCCAEHASQQFGQFNGGCPNQHWLSFAMALPNILDGGFVFFFCCFVNPVELVISFTGFVGRNDDSL